MKREELNALLSDAAERGGGTFILNLCGDDPIALLNRTLAQEKAEELKAAAKAAAEQMKAEKCVLLLPEDFDGFALDGAETLTMDFSKLEYISSAGLRVLLSAQKAMGAKGGMKVTNVNEIVKEVFEVTGFTDILTIE